MTFAAITAATYAVMSAPSQTRRHLGLRGLKRAQTLKTNDFFRDIEPTMRWLSTRVSGLLSPGLRAHLDRQIVLAGEVWGLEPEDFVALTLMSGATGASVSGVYGMFTTNAAALATLGGCLGLALPYIQLTGEQQERMRRIQLALPHMVDLLALSLGAGIDFQASVRQIVEKASRSDEPLMEELALVLQELNVGRTRREALVQFGNRAPCEVVLELVAAVVQSEEQGIPLASVIKTQAATSRARRSVRAEELAARAGAQLIVPVMLLFGCIILLMMGPMVLELTPILSK